MPPLWKLLTFTANFGLKTGVAFSHVWSLCIEEQFYLVLPFIAVFVFYRKSYRLAWSLLGLLLLGGVGLRSYIWMVYTNGMAHNPDFFNYNANSA